MSNPLAPRAFIFFLMKVCASSVMAYFLLPTVVLASRITLPFGYLQQGSLSIPATQTLYPNVCSTQIGIGLNYGGKATNPKSTVTLNFATTGTLAVYSDAGCINQITSATIGPTSSVSNIYVMASGTGANTITVTATGGNFSYLPVSQSYTSITNPYVWTGLAGDNVFSTNGNWSGGIAPNSLSQVAYFDNSCTTYCSPHITSSVTLAGIKMTSTFTGTLYQNSGAALSLNGRGFIQQAGTFVGSSSGDAITFTGGGGQAFYIGSGSFTSTSGTLSLPNQLWYVAPGASFNHNNGTIIFAGSGSTGTGSITPGSSPYYNIQFAGCATTSTFYGNMTVAGNILSSGCGTGAIAVNGNYTIFVAGNVTLTAYGLFGSANITLNGNTNQTIDASGATDGGLPGLTIASTGGTVSILGNLDLHSSYTWSSGTVNLGTSNFYFSSLSNGSSITPGSFTYNNVTIQGSGNNAIITINGSWNIGGSLTLNATSAFNYSLNAGTSGAIYLSGNLNLLNYGAGGNIPLHIIGASPTITGSSTPTQNSNIPYTYIEASGTVTLANTIAPTVFVATSGTIAAGTSTLYFWGCGSCSFNPGASNTYYNVTMIPRSGAGYPVAVQGTLKVSNNFLIGQTGYTTVVNMPSSGGPYSVTVNNLTLATTTSTFNLNGASLSYTTQTLNGGTINP